MRTGGFTRGSSQGRQAQAQARRQQLSPRAPALSSIIQGLNFSGEGFLVKEPQSSGWEFGGRSAEIQRGPSLARIARRTWRRQPSLRRCREFVAMSPRRDDACGGPVRMDDRRLRCCPADSGTAAEALPGISASVYALRAGRSRWFRRSSLPRMHLDRRSRSPGEVSGIPSMRADRHHERLERLASRVGNADVSTRSERRVQGYTSGGTWDASAF